MRHLRAVARIALILTVTFVLICAWNLGRIAAFRSPRSVRRFKNWIKRVWSRSLCRIMGIKIRSDGPVPSSPFCMVTNHLSYVDILILQVNCDSRLIARADIKHWPLIGFLARHFDTLFIDRASTRDVVRVGLLIESVISAGESVTFFPEGTSTGGKVVGPFRSALLEFQARTSFPVHYAAISYQTLEGDPPASSAVCWWGAMTFPSHVYRMLGLRRFFAHVTYGNNPVRGTNRKSLAGLLQEKVESVFQPSR